MQSALCTGLAWASKRWMVARRLSLECKESWSESVAQVMQMASFRKPEGLVAFAQSMHGFMDASKLCNALHWLGVLHGTAMGLQQLDLNLDYLPCMPPLVALRHLSLTFHSAASASAFESVRWVVELESYSLAYHGHRDDGDASDAALVPALDLAALAGLRYVHMWRVQPTILLLSAGCALDLSFRQPPKDTAFLQPAAACLREVMWLGADLGVMGTFPALLRLPDLSSLHRVSLHLESIGSPEQTVALPSALLRAHTLTMCADTDVCLLIVDIVSWQYLKLRADFLWLVFYEHTYLPFVTSPPSFDIGCDCCKGTVWMDLAKGLGDACEVGLDQGGSTSIRHRAERHVQCKCGFCYQCLVKAANLRNPTLWACGA